MSDFVSRPMRRFDRAVTGLQDMLAILEKSKVLHLGMTGPEGPYVVPLNFAYRESNGILTLFFHCAQSGKKVDMLAADDRVCFEVDCSHQLVEGTTACSYGYSYESVIGFGKARLLTDQKEKIDGLSALIMRFSQAEAFEFDPSVVERTAVYVIDVAHITGKRR
ncbi:MAG: pyridoxamine 5'-phosphate oxidase family protein [Candidatus Pelethousia sp.]|nr:pyridoxamine 5'-phosphate oxidase family protein [Candidatus Pelethousia sp.]